MKVVLLGGSSAATPNLFAHLRRHPDHPARQVVLVGRSHTRLAAVERAARLLLADAAVEVRTVSTCEPRWGRCLDGAGAVVLQVRPGGYAARRRGEATALAHGAPGDESVGPGALAVAWRAWPEVAELLAEVGRRAPGVPLVVLTSPLGLMVHGAHRLLPGHPLLGVCELPWTTLEGLAGATGGTGTTAAELRFDYLGVNHLGWLYGVESEGHDLVRHFARRQVGDGFPSRRLVESYRAVPLPYLRLHFERREAVSEQRHQLGRRSRFLAGHRRRCQEVFAGGDRRAIETVLAERPAPWYPLAVAPLLAALGGRPAGRPLFLSRRNGGAVPELAADLVLELPHRPAARGLEAWRHAPAPEPVLSLVRRFATWEQAAATAMLERDEGQLASALAAHPWLSREDGEAMARDLTTSRGAAVARV